jgi:hypothetical protein
LHSDQPSGPGSAKDVRCAEHIGQRLAGFGLKDYVADANPQRLSYWCGDPDTKRLILECVGSNPILKDKKLIIEAKNPFHVRRMS